MSLHLDTRQRAMLEAMHIKLWQPAPAVPPDVSNAPKKGAAGVRNMGAEGSFVSENSAAPPSAPPASVRPVAAPAPAVSAAPPPVQSPAVAPVAGSFTLQPPRLLYPQVDPAQTPAALGAGWLVVAESDGASAQNPFQGDAGRLLDNMLRAMQLHRHPRVHRLDVTRGPAQGVGGPDLQAALAATLAELRPSVVLVMGRVAALALLQRSEPLGRLRGQVHSLHSLHGVPVVVTFEAPYLLRAQADKARAWADLCLALRVVEEANAAAL